MIRTPSSAVLSRRLALAGLLGLALATHLPAVRAQSLPVAKPEEVGLSAQRLARISDWLKAEVAQKKIPGAVIMVVRGGKAAYLDAFANVKVGVETADAQGNKTLELVAPRRPMTVQDLLRHTCSSSS